MKIKAFIFCLLVCVSGIFSQSKNIDSLKKLTAVDKPDSQRVSSSYHLFREYFRKGKNDSAFYFNNLIYSIYKNTGTPAFYGTYLNDLGVVQHSYGSYDSALYYYSLSLKYREKAGDEWAIAQSYNNMGNSWTNKGDLRKALEFHEKSLALKKKLKDNRGIGQSLYNIGNIKVSLGLYKEALEHYLEAMGVGEKTGYQELLMNGYGAIGNVYSKINDYEKSKTYFEKALDLAVKYDDKKVIAINYGNLAGYYYHISDTAKAAELFRKALVMNEVVGNKYGIAMIYNSFGSMEIDYKNFDKALLYFERALGMADAAGHSETQCLIHVNIGAAYLKKKEFQKAWDIANKGLKIAEHTESMKNILDFHQLKALAANGLGKYKDAYDEFVLWGNMKDSLTGLNNIRELSTMEMKADYQKQQALDRAEQEKKDAVAVEESKKEKIIKYSLIGVALFVLIIALLVYRSYKQKSKDNLIIKSQKEEVELQKKMVEEKNAVVEEKNKEITDSIKYAKRLQDAILPPLSLIKHYLPESFLLYLPKDIIAGDFYWMEIVKGTGDEGQGTKDFHASLILLAACDCTGHGVPGAMVSVVCSNALNRAVKEFGIHEPGKILDKTRELVLETFSSSMRVSAEAGKNESDVKDGMDISLVSIEYIADDSNKKQNEVTRLQWSGANNPLWYYDSSTSGITEIKANKQPIGKSDDPKPFITHKTELKKNDIIYLFTDGYADQFGGEKGKKFKYKPLQQLLLSASADEMEVQKTTLEKNFLDWKRELEQIDDVCVIGVRI